MDSNSPVEIKRRLGGRSERVQKAVFSAALDLLLREGYEQINMAGIAAHAGVNQTSLYRRWKNKETLLMHMILARVSEEIPTPDGGSLRSDLIALLRDAVALMQTSLGVALLQVSAAGLSHAEFGRYRQAYWEERKKQIQTVFERAVQRGELSGKQEPSQVVEMLLGPIYVRLLFTDRRLNDLDVEKIVDSVLSGFSFP